MSLQSGNFDETFLTVAEVAEMLKLNPQTVRNWIDQGRMPALRVGRRVRIRRSDLERVLEKSSTTTAAAAAARDAGPTAEDFWGGEPIGVAETADGSARALGDPSAPAATPVAGEDARAPRDPELARDPDSAREAEPAENSLDPRARSAPPGGIAP